MCMCFGSWAQGSDVTVAVPTPGEATEPSKLPAEDLPGSPLADGLSFDALRDVLKALLYEKNFPTRGAREIGIFRQAAPAVVLIKTREGSGSGIILKNGLILTNRHVVEGVGKVQIFFKPTHSDNGNTETLTSEGLVKFVDVKRDLAIIAPESLPSNATALNISNSDNFDVGQDVFAIGHPMGYTWTFTQGIISGIRTIDNDAQHYTAIQTQTPINPGNSGGPLLNSDLEVVGINTWAVNFSSVKKEQIGGEEATLARPAQGLNFAVSAPDLRSFVSDAMSGKLSTLALQLPSARSGCAGKTLFDGRAKRNDAALKIFSLGCDGFADAWEIFPDDKSKPVEYHLDTDHSSKSNIVVYTDPKTGQWSYSLWDFFRDQTFAVVGHHDTGKIQPTRFDFTRM